MSETIARDAVSEAVRRCYQMTLSEIWEVDDAHRSSGDIWYIRFPLRPEPNQMEEEVDRLTGWLHDVRQQGFAGALAIDACDGGMWPPAEPTDCIPGVAIWYNKDCPAAVIWPGTFLEAVMGAADVQLEVAS